MSAMRVAVIGPEKTGKSAWLMRQITGNFAPGHAQAEPVRYSLNYWTNLGQKTLHFVELPSGSPSEGLGQYDACIWFYDGRSPVPAEVRAHPNAVLVWSLLDAEPSRSASQIADGSYDLPSEQGTKSRAFRALQLLSSVNRYCPYYDISAKTLYNQEKPILAILRARYGKELHFTLAHVQAAKL